MVLRALRCNQPVWVEKKFGYPTVTRKCLAVHRKLHLKAPLMCASQPQWAPQSEVISDVDKPKLDEMLERFKQADLDGSGRIDREELAVLLNSTEGGKTTLLSQYWLTQEELDSLMKKYDTDNSGDIDYEEFQKLVVDGLLLDGKLHEYEEAFRAVDKSGNGTMCATELLQLFRDLGQPLSYEKMVAIFQQYDRDESGQIDFSEFLRMFRGQLLDLDKVQDYLMSKAAAPEGEGEVLAEDARVRVIMSEEELDQLLQQSGDKLVVLFCALTWCRPCRAMQSSYVKLAGHYPETIFLKLFGDTSTNTKRLFRDRLRVRSTPAFLFFRNGELVNSTTGYNKNKLEAAIRDQLKESELIRKPLYVLPVATT